MNVYTAVSVRIHVHTAVSTTQADSPNPDKLPPEDVVGVTVVLLTCSFRSNEFVRVGFYVNNEYTDAELAENPPAVPVFEKVSVTTAHPSQLLYTLRLVLFAGIDFSDFRNDLEI